MDMSKAALPPRAARIAPKDEGHPLVPLWRQTCASCARWLVEAPHFRDWLTNYEWELKRANAAADSRYSRFLDWMLANQGGARPCPAGAFPHNFYFWLEGGRW